MSTDVMTNPKTTTKEKKRISTKIIAQIETPPASVRNPFALWLGS